MKELFLSAARLQDFCEQRSWAWCFIGGLAVQRWGEPRLTEDTDLTLLTGFGSEESFVDALLARYRPRRADARDFALMNRVLLLFAEDGSGIDIALGALPFEASAVGRASYFDFIAGARLKTCSGEDLIVMKAFANRDLDWIDVRGILVRQSGKLDWKYVIEQLTPLAELKEMPELVDRLEKLRQSVSCT